jgi:general nucleoside transport system permease protein
MMVVGASVGFLVSLKSGSNLTGLVAAALAGGVFGFVLASMTTLLRLDQFVVGLALFFAPWGSPACCTRWSSG